MRLGFVSATTELHCCWHLPCHTLSLNVCAVSPFASLFLRPETFAIPSPSPLLLSTALPSPPHPSPPPTHQPILTHPTSHFLLTLFVSLIGMRDRNLSAFKTCTTFLCVGQHFTDERLSTQRLYMHAFAFENAEAVVKHKSVQCYICTHISHPSSCF